MEVIRGYSKTTVPKHGTFYIKHLDLFSSEEIDEKKREYEEHARSRGLPTSEEKIAELEKDDLWSPQKEREIKNLESMIERLKITKSKFVLKADLDAIQKQIEDSIKEHEDLLKEKTELMGYTCDSYAFKKMNEFFIFSTSYKTPELKELFFDKKTSDEFHEIEVALLVENYNNVGMTFDEKNLKRIALSGFFLNSFYLCKNNPFTFFGKPIIELTYNQSELFSYGSYFKHVLEELKHEPDPETMDDPDKLIEMFNVSKNSEKIKEKMSDKDATTVVGATKEDMQRMGITAGPQDTGISLSKEAAKRGGSLNMEELINLHGA